MVRMTMTTKMTSRHEENEEDQNDDKQNIRILPLEMLSTAMCCFLLCLLSIHTKLFEPAHEHLEALAAERQHQWLLDFYWYNIKKDSFYSVKVI